MKYLWSILIILCFRSFGQDINHFSFNDLYDFEVNTIFDISQSKDDVMWFGTSEGLFSFDGVEFKKYVNEKFAIAYTNIKFDRKGRVWCSNFGGQLFYLENDSLKLALNWSSNSQFITEYDINNLPKIRIIGSNIGLIQEFDLENLNYRDVLFESERTKILTLSTEQGLKYAVHHYDRTKDKGALKIYKTGTLPVEQNLECNIDIHIPAGKWGLFGSDAQFFIKSVQKEVRILSIQDDSVQVILPELDLSTYRFNDADFIDDRIWVLSKRGVSIFNKDGTPYLENFLDGFSASSVFKDHEGNIWLSSLNRGLIIMPNLHFKSVEISENSIAHSTSDGEGNIYSIDDRGSLFKTSPPYRIGNIRLLSNGSLEPAPLFYDQRSNRLMIGSFRQYYDLENNQLKNTDPLDIRKNLRFKASEYIGKGFYINTYYSQAFLININGEGHPPLNFNMKRESVIRSYRSKYVGAPLSKSGVYVDYIDGLFYYDIVDAPKRIKWKNRDIQSAEITPDPHEKDIVWISTKSKELLKLKKGEVITSISLPAIARRIALHENYIFLAAQRGIYRIKRLNEEIQVIDETDGWIKGRVTTLLLHNDQCVIVGNNYIQTFPINYETINRVKPSIFITDVKVGDSSYQVSKEMEFPPESSFLTFRFRGLSVRSQKQMTYQYRLVNESKEWITTSFENPEARFLNLGAGKYTFEVRMCNGSNVCSEVKAIDFSIQLPYYKKWWFITLVVGFVVGLIFFLVRFWYKNKADQEHLQSEQQRLKKEIYKSKIAAIRSQMNPHFMFNALNTIQEFILTNQQDIASEYLADFADLMRMYLNQSNEDNVSLSEEEETLRLYLRLESLRFNGDLDFSISFDPSINKDGTSIPVMLLQPYIENSIKHGLLHKKGTKRLCIEFTTTNDKQLKITITDNGVGRKASERINSSKSIGHKSFATGANDHRVDLINQNRDKRIKVDIIDLYEEGEAAGTRVEIFVK